jgi:hypothetical protein
MVRERARIHRRDHHGGERGHHKHGGEPHNPGKAQPNKTAGYGVTQAGANSTKNFNKDLIYVQGFRQVVAAGATVPVTVSLASPGRWLHGIAFIPTSASDISDTQLNLVVNNNNLLTKAAAENANPGFTQGQIFFPTPQPLQGQDTITLNITNNGSAPVTVTTNFFYVPRV